MDPIALIALVLAAIAVVLLGIVIFQMVGNARKRPEQQGRPGEKGSEGEY